MDLREEHLAKEQDSWQAFLAVVDTVPPDRLEDPTVVPGWSVKDLIWHNASWANFAATELDKMTGLPWIDPFASQDDAHWDQLSYKMIDEGRTRTYDEVLTDAERTRERVRATWQALPTIDEHRAKWFAEETWIHYQEHTREIQQFLNHA